MDDTNKPRKAITEDGVAFASGVILAVACRLSGEYMDFVNQRSAFDLTLTDIQISLVGPTTILLFLGVLWAAQKILRSFYGDPNLSLFKRESPAKASRFLAFILGYFIAGILLSFLASLL